jgi:hypothetical protein
MKIFVNLGEFNPNLFLSPEKYVWIYGWEIGSCLRSQGLSDIDRIVGHLMMGGLEQG